MRKTTVLVAVALVVVLAVFSLIENRQSTAQQTSIPNALQDVPKMQKWEYITQAYAPGDFNDLNDRGKHGWDFCQAITIEDGQTKIIFKRQLK